MKKIGLGIALCVTALGMQAGAGTSKFRVTTDASRERNFCYGVGDKATVSVSVEDGNGQRLAIGLVDAYADDGWTNVVWRRSVDLSAENPFTVELSRKTPGSLRLHLAAKGIRSRMDRLIFGVNEIRPLTPCPADFEAYWNGERRRFDSEVPCEIEKTPAHHLDTDDHSAFYVSTATFSGGRIYGILMVPRAAGRFPACVVVPGAGPGRTSLSGRLVRKGWITLLMNIHGFPIGKTQEEHKQRYDEWLRALCAKSGEPTYQRSGFAVSREAPIYHDSMLAMVRMVDWLSKEPHTDASRFVYCGGSQGGGYGIYLTALWGRFAKSLIVCPNMCDMMAYREGRMPGSEHIMDQTPAHRPLAEKTGPYYDACNFARLIHTPVRMAYGICDDNCNTVGGIAAFNSIPSKDKQLKLVPGLGHGWKCAAGLRDWVFDLP